MSLKMVEKELASAIASYLFKQSGIPIHNHSTLHVVNFINETTLLAVDNVNNDLPLHLKLPNEKWEIEIIVRKKVE